MKKWFLAKSCFQPKSSSIQYTFVWNDNILYSIKNMSSDKKVWLENCRKRVEIAKKGFPMVFVERNVYSLYNFDSKDSIFSNRAFSTRKPLSGQSGLETP